MHRILSLKIVLRNILNFHIYFWRISLNQFFTLCRLIFFLFIRILSKILIFTKFIKKGLFFNLMIIFFLIIFFKDKLIKFFFIFLLFFLFTYFILLLRKIILILFHFRITLFKLVFFKFLKSIIIY